MISRFVGAATLFTAGSLMAGAAPTLGATPIQGTGSASAAWVLAGCGNDKKDDTAKPDKAKDGSCGKASCGSKDPQAKKDGSCGKGKTAAKKDGSCGKGKKEASCGKGKKEASCGKDKPADAKKDGAQPDKM